MNDDDMWLSEEIIQASDQARGQASPEVGDEGYYRLIVRLAMGAAPPARGEPEQIAFLDEVYEAATRDPKAVTLLVWHMAMLFADKAEEENERYPGEPRSAYGSILRTAPQLGANKTVPRSSPTKTEHTKTACSTFTLRPRAAAYSCVRWRDESPRRSTPGR